MSDTISCNIPAWPLSKENRRTCFSDSRLEFRSERLRFAFSHSAISLCSFSFHSGGWIGLREFWATGRVVEHKGAKVPLSLIGEVAFAFSIRSLEKSVDAARRFDNRGLPADSFHGAAIRKDSQRRGIRLRGFVGDAWNFVCRRIIKLPVQIEASRYQLVANGVISFEAGISDQAT